MVRISEPIILSKDTLFGMSNAGLDTWDKVHRGKSLMESALSSNIDLGDLGDHILTSVLQNDTKSPSHLVQQTDNNTFYIEHMLSSIFVRNNYHRDCCVSSIVLVMDQSNTCYMMEHRYSWQG